MSEREWTREEVCGIVGDLRGNRGEVVFINLGTMVNKGKVVGY